MRWKKVIFITLTILAVLTGAAAIVFYPFYRFMFQESTQFIGSDLEIVCGGGGNSGILVADSAVVVIDTKMGGDAEKLHSLAKSKAGNKKIIVINTHYHRDHTSGNKYYKGCDIFIGAYDPNQLLGDVGAECMPGRFVKDSLILDLGTETVCLYNLGQGHTLDDMVVLLRNHKVLFSGDLVFHRINPFLKKESGADVDKWIVALDRMMKIPGVVTIVPGHGETGNRGEISLMKQYFTDMKTAAADPSREQEMKDKYRDWVEMRMMTSPGITIDYIRHTP